MRSTFIAMTNSAMEHLVVSSNLLVISPTAILTINDVSIEVSPYISEEFLRTLIKAVHHA